MNEFMHTDGIKTVHDVDASEDNRDMQEVSGAGTNVFG
jgi:DNA replication protein DnaD